MLFRRLRWLSFRAYLHGSRAKTLYIWGENDMALGEDAAMRTKDFVKAPYQFVRLAGHAHWLPNEGEPDLQPIILAHLRAYD
jgi:pimeloyl-ACP methyl ester carboxylesterase